MNKDIFDDYEFLEQKFKEGLTCVLRGRSIYNLTPVNGTVRAKKFKSYPKKVLPLPFTLVGRVVFWTPADVERLLKREGII